MKNMVKSFIQIILLLVAILVLPLVFKVLSKPRVFQSTTEPIENHIQLRTTIENSFEVIAYKDTMVFIEDLVRVSHLEREYMTTQFKDLLKH